jgi:WNK lysine deficient protein kinase
MGFSKPMKDYKKHRIVGTIGFMALEIFEEDYNELVDIYAFGMCVLEMVTNKYPYEECNNAPHIYKKVKEGKEPAALRDLANHEVQAFIRKCLAHPSHRPSVVQLLLDPFLAENLIIT